MPLMQLSTLVLPAPLGPMRANSSPCPIANDTFSRMVSPPKRRPKRSMASSAMPPPRAAILFDVAVGAPLAGGLAQVELLDVLMTLESFAISVEDDASVLHHISVIGDLQSRGRALFNQQDADAEFVAYGPETTGEVLDNDRGQAERQLVDQQKLRPAHQGRADRQHLPLAAGQKAGSPASQFGKTRKEMIGALLDPPFFIRTSGARYRCSEVFRDGEIGKYLFALRHQHNPSAGDLVRQFIVDPRAFERNRSFGDARVIDAEESGDRAKRCGLARAVGAEDRHNLPFPDRQCNALHGSNDTLINHLDVVDLQQSGSHLRAPASGLYLKGQSKK